MNENLLDANQKQDQDQLIGTSPPSQGKSKFSITPQELTNLMNLYKSRADNYADIKYFSDRGGVSSLLTALDTNKQTGITSEEGRAEHFGTNKVFEKPIPSFCDFVIEAISDKMIIILLCASVVEIGISIYNYVAKDEKNMDWLDGVSIIVAVFVVVLVGSITNYKKEMKFHDLNDFQNQSTKYGVIRKGVPRELLSDDLLVGDLIKVNYGEILPADLLLIEGNAIKIDESTLTGESDPQKKNIFEKCVEEIENKVKNPSSNLLMSGTNVIEGSGKAIVIAIGKHSQKGIIRGTIDNASEDGKTPLEQKLDDIANLIGYFGLGSAALTFVALGIKLLLEYIRDPEQMTLSVAMNKILRILILCVSIIVVAIPEGLPLAVTLSLAFSIKKMMDQNNLVRKMHACETMGGANYICTDKTGTLTENKMRAVALITNDSRLEIKTNLDVANAGGLDSNKNANTELRQDHTELFSNEEYWKVLRTAISVNVDCSITKLDTPDVNGDTEICDTRNKTDNGFIKFLYQLKSPISEELNTYLSYPEYYKKYPFDSKKKRMSTLIKHESFPTGYRLFTKGGGENAMVFSNRYISKETGEVLELTENDKNYVVDQIDKQNKQMIRSLYVAYKDITEDQFIHSDDLDENGYTLDQTNLIFIGVIGLRDSLRNRVKESVVSCHEAGVKVVMVTGDNIVTATAIAKECNILPKTVDLQNLKRTDIEQNPNDINYDETRDKHIEEILNDAPIAITGNTFFAAIEGLYCEVCGEDTGLCQCPKTEAEAIDIAAKTKREKKEVKKDAVKNMEAFKKLTKNLRVMARSQPLHKYALVLGLKTLGNVVAVTGDGTNDAPALSRSDVGFAMIEGTDIAKEASDIVILDNNFASVVTAVIYGRSIYENIRKFLQFQLTVNFCACVLVFICSCVGSETPLTSIQMLWVNLIMDSLGSLALATEPPYDELLKRRPTDKNESIINGTMWKHIILQAVCEIAILLVLYLAAPKFIPENKEDIVKSHRALYKCFGQLPGNQPFDENNNMPNILYGTESDWSADVKIKPEMIDDGLCKDYITENEDSKADSTLFDAFNYYEMKHGSTTHMTYIFNVFVFYTLFNQLNCRVIDDSFNIFARITKGYLFTIVTIGEMAIQAFIVQIGKNVFHCVDGGLSFRQWLYCIGFSLTTVVFNFFIKLIPIQHLIDPLLKKKNAEEEEEGVPPHYVQPTRSTNDISNSGNVVEEKALLMEEKS